MPETSIFIERALGERLAWETVARIPLSNCQCLAAVIVGQGADPRKNK